jgi:peptidoglycan/LPS O-acetylase OafA/YrhL
MMIAIRLYDLSPEIDSWAVAHFGPVAGMQDHFQDSFVRWLLYFSPYLRVGEFVLGALIAQLYLRLQSRRITALENAIGFVFLVAAAGSILPVMYLEYSPDVAINMFRKTSLNFALAPSAALLIFTAARYRNAISRMLSSRVLITLGEASYSTYLVHYVVLMSVMQATGWASHGIVGDVIELIVVMSAILLISVALYTFYEAPARKWLRRWGNLRSRAALPESPRPVPPRE